MKLLLFLGRLYCTRSGKFKESERSANLAITRERSISNTIGTNFKFIINDIHCSAQLDSYQPVLHALLKSAQ